MRSKSAKATLQYGFLTYYTGKTCACGDPLTITYSIRDWLLSCDGHIPCQVPLKYFNSFREALNEV